MTTAQTNYTFIQELKSLGMVIPENSQKVVISADGAEDPVSIVFHQMTFDSPVVKKTAVKLLSKDGSHMLAKEFYNLVKEYGKLPDETCSFTISANMNEIVFVDIRAAFPIDGLKNLQGYTFKQTTKSPSPMKDIGHKASYETFSTRKTI